MEEPKGLTVIRLQTEEGQTGLLFGIAGYGPVTKFLEVGQFDCDLRVEAPYDSGAFPIRNKEDGSLEAIFIPDDVTMNAAISGAIAEEEVAITVLEDVFVDALYTCTPETEEE